MEEFFYCIIIPLIVIYSWHISSQEIKERNQGPKTQCPTCKGTGQFKSGQWGGFWDTCGKCHGTGRVPKY